VPRSFLVALALGLAALGCTPSIGDKCTQSTDCSQLGDRLCDPTQPEGYCTIFNCEPDTCPNSVCVGFNFELDPACGTADDGKTPRFERTFCMKLCNSTTDCRDGYVCLAPKDRAARVVDDTPIGSYDEAKNEKVCMADITLPAATPPGSTPGVCEPVDAGSPWTPFDGGVGGSGGAGGGTL
jgi:hypothetical protein